MPMLDVKRHIIAVACCMSDEVGYPTGTPREGFEDIPAALESLVSEGVLVRVGLEERGGEEWAIYRLSKPGEIVSGIDEHSDPHRIPGTDLPPQAGPR